MNKIMFVYFEGCPNASKVLEILEKLDIGFETFEQNSLPQGNKLKDYSSPTILLEDQIILGTEANGGGCTLNLKMEDLKDFLLSIK